MTNYNERLDKILMGVWHEGYNRCNQEKNHPDGYDNYSYSMDENQAKQAILRWVADEVIGEDEEETIEDKLGGKYRFNSNKRRRNIVRRNQRKILAQHGYKGANQ